MRVIYTFSMPIFYTRKNKIFPDFISINKIPTSNRFSRAQFARFNKYVCYSSAVSTFNENSIIADFREFYLIYLNVPFYYSQGF